jgi:hypothetical protein
MAALKLLQRLLFSSCAAVAGCFVLHPRAPPGSGGTVQGLTNNAAAEVRGLRVADFHYGFRLSNEDDGGYSACGSPRQRRAIIIQEAAVLVAAKANHQLSHGIARLLHSEVSVGSTHVSFHPA